MSGNQHDAVHCRYTTQRLNLWRHQYSWASLAERGAGMRSGISSALSHVAWSISPVRGFSGGVRPISARCVEHVSSVRLDLPQTTSLPNDDGRKTRARAFLRASRYVLIPKGRLRTLISLVKGVKFVPVAGSVDASPRASGWSAMLNVVRDSDKDKIEDCKEDIDTLLVFVRCS